LAQGGAFTSIDVHDVGNVVEGVEGNADRQEQVGNGEVAAEKLGEAVELHGEEAEVLPHDQRTDVETDHRD
jgi:hypothetical protein